MSEYVPFEIQAEIIKKVVPVKSLIRFRSVSKQWKTLIDSPEFITHHTFNNRADTHHLLVRYYVDSEYKCVSIVDDDDCCFPQHKSPLVSPSVKKLVYDGKMLHCSHGLVCLYGYLAGVNGERMLIMWNPSIRKSVSIMLPYQLMVVGVGVCPKTSDPKIVKITRSSSSSIDRCEAEVFTLSTRAWRSISMNMPLSRSIGFSGRSSQVVVNGVIYWSTYDDLPNEERWDLIVSFDLTSEEFGKVDLPDSLTHGNLSIGKLNDSLAVLNINEWEATCDVWVMREKGFVKLFSLTPYDGYEVGDIIGFRRNGQPIREREREHPSRLRDGSLVTKLEAYEPSTKHSSDLGIYLPHSDRAVRAEITSYTESLLLLNHSDSINQV